MMLLGNGMLEPFHYTVRGRASPQRHKDTKAGEPLAGRLDASGEQALLYSNGNTVNRVLPESAGRGGQAKPPVLLRMGQFRASG
jgi:hypothetical protein